MSDAPHLTTADDRPEDNDQSQEPVTDLLVNMFLKQAHHIEDYNEIYRKRGHLSIDPRDWGNINDPRVQMKLRETWGYVVEEMGEAFNLLKNKPWKNTLKETDPEEFYGELADAWHFWLELMILAGMNPDVVARHYFKMAEKNDQRKVSGY